MIEFVMLSAIQDLQAVLNGMMNPENCQKEPTQSYGFPRKDVKTELFFTADSLVLLQTQVSCAV